MGTTATARVADAGTRVRELSPHQLDLEVMTGGCRLVDLRDADVLDAGGTIATAIHVPRGPLVLWADPEHALHRPELDPARRTVVFCESGRHSALAARTLLDLGYVDVAHLAGGFTAWRAAGLPVVARP